MNQLLASSANPKELSLTIKGYLMALMPALVELLQLIKVPATESDVVIWIQIISLAIALGVASVGMLRKVYFVLKDTLTKMLA